jgi:hypothetical protein
VIFTINLVVTRCTSRSINESFILMVSIKRSGDALHLDSRVADRVLPAARRDYSANVTGGAAAGKISSVHDDIGVTFGLDDCLCIECPL